MSYYEVSPMQSIELTGKSKKCFWYFYLVLDSKSLTKECESTTYDHKAEVLLGEAKENLSKVKTTITMCMAIGTIYHLRAYLANICTVIEVQFICNCPSKTFMTLPCLLWPAPLPCTSPWHRCRHISRRATSHTSP